MAVRSDMDRNYVATRGDRVDVYNTTAILPGRLRRISWGAIIAGIAVALVTMIALNMLGIAIGAATINPTEEADPLQTGLGTGAVIWFAASTLIALFLGGGLAGRMSGVFDEGDGALHGLVVWAVVTLLTLWSLTTSVGNIINGVTNAAGQAITAVGGAVADVSPEVANAIQNQDNTLQAIINEATTLSAEQTEEGLQIETQGGEQITLSQAVLAREIRNFFAINPAEVTDAERESLATALAENTTLTQEEAMQRVNQWETTYANFRADVEETVRSVGQTLADTATAFAGYIFAAMVLGAFAAGAGGYWGAPHIDRDEEVVTAEDVRERRTVTS